MASLSKEEKITALEISRYGLRIGFMLTLLIIMIFVSDLINLSQLEAYRNWYWLHPQSGDMYRYAYFSAYNRTFYTIWALPGFFVGLLLGIYELRNFLKRGGTMTYKRWFEFVFSFKLLTMWLFVLLSAITILTINAVFPASTNFHRVGLIYTLVYASIYATLAFFLVYRVFELKRSKIIILELKKEKILLRLLS